MKILLIFSGLILFDTLTNALILKNISLEITLLLSYCLIPIDLVFYRKIMDVIRNVQ